VKEKVKREKRIKWKRKRNLVLKFLDKISRIV